LVWIGFDLWFLAIYQGRKEGQNICHVVAAQVFSDWVKKAEPSSQWKDDCMSKERGSQG
jgi:hypothetical protein